MGSASQQLSQLIDGGSLSPSLAYLLLCDAIFGFWLPGSVSLFPFLFHLRIFASLLRGVFLPFLCLKGLVCVKLFAKLGCCRTLCPSP
jgi:hypothetical protein